MWARYGYRLGSAPWGDPARPVRLAPEWDGSLPPMTAPLQAAGRAGCDVAPVDLEDEASRKRLRAYVWPNRTNRLTRPDAAIAVARG